MKKPLQIGITGGIGAGKSLVAKIFNVLGVPVYDADRNARKLMSTDSELIALIKKELGGESYLADGTLNKKFIAHLAFESADKIGMLNSLVHPRVAADYAGWVTNQRIVPYVVKEAALLYESGSYKDLNGIIVVSAPLSMRIKRVLQRDPQRTETDVKNIIRKQMSEEEKVSLADYVVINDETQLVIPQVLRLDAALNEKIALM